MVVNMNRITVVCEGEQKNIDNELLFQKILAIASTDQVELESDLCFELKSQLASLFNKEGLINTKNKPALAEALPKLQWKTCQTVKLIYQHYVNYVNGKLCWMAIQMK